MNPYNHRPPVYDGTSYANRPKKRSGLWTLLFAVTVVGSGAATFAPARRNSLHENGAVVRSDVAAETTSEMNAMVKSVNRHGVALWKDDVEQHTSLGKEYRAILLDLRKNELDYAKYCAKADPFKAAAAPKDLAAYKASLKILHDCEATSMAYTTRDNELHNKLQKFEQDLEGRPYAVTDQVKVSQNERTRALKTAFKKLHLVLEYPRHKGGNKAGYERVCDEALSAFKTWDFAQERLNRAWKIQRALR